jgi:uncharacterized protein
MKVEGTYEVPAPRELVYARLLDPKQLAPALPGCEKLESAPDGSYHAEMKVGIGAITGVYQGRVEVLDQVPPERFRMKVSGQGKGGFLKGEGALVLSESAAGTSIHYSGDAQVGGIFAAVGQRMIQAATRQILREFFQAFTKHLPQVPPS